MAYSRSANGEAGRCPKTGLQRIGSPWVQWVAADLRFCAAGVAAPADTGNVSLKGACNSPGCSAGRHVSSHEAGWCPVVRGCRYGCGV